MTHEHIQFSETPPEGDPTFTRHEELVNRVTDERFRAFLDDPQATIHRVEISSNSYGSFLFVTLSRQRDERRECLTFFGLGFHEYRERWFTKDWFWYRGNWYPELREQQLSREEADALIQERLDDIRPDVTAEPPSRHGRLFELLADLTDEDGALAELEDLGDVADWLIDDLE